MPVFGRVVVIAPTRSTCVNLSDLIANGSLPETLIQRECGSQLSSATAQLSKGGFGVVAGTGTGKSAAIRQLCLDVLGQSLSIGIVTQEHRNTRVNQHNVIVITPGVAVKWAKSGDIGANDLVVIDEIHQTSEHIELAMALLKRTGCKFVWMSATVNPSSYSRHLEAREVISCSAYDPARRAKVIYHHFDIKGVLEECLPDIAARQQGVAVFVPTREEAEKLSAWCDGQYGVSVGFYHGGESAEKLRDYIEGNIPRPFILFMTAAGSSSLNVSGLSMVIIVDACYKEIVRGGKRCLVRSALDNNTMLQMAGRVDGRAIGGEVHIVSKRYIDLRMLRPVDPEFVLGGNLELLALSTAKIGVDARRLELIGDIDLDAYQHVFDRLITRGLIRSVNGQLSLTSLGERVECLPVNCRWGEIIATAKDLDIEELLFVACIVASVGELYSIVGKNLRRHSPHVVEGSDHLTGYNIVAEALQQYGKLNDARTAYRIGGADYDGWCKQWGYSSKGIRRVVMDFVSILRGVGVQPPNPQDFVTVHRGELLHQGFVELIAMVQSLEYVPNLVHGLFGNDQFGVTSGQSVLGTVRRWTSNRGNACSTIEGTAIPYDVVKRYAVESIEGCARVSRFAGVEISREVVSSGAREDALDLRDEANKLLRLHKGRLSEVDWQSLVEFDIDDDALPTDNYDLNSWIQAAKTAIRRAKIGLSLV